MPVPRAPVAPLQTMVSFVPDVEDGSFAQLAQENQQRLWDMEDEANYWRVTPLLLAETAPPDWVHVGRYLDTNTKLYQSYKDHQLTINALSASRAARAVATEDMFF